MSIIKKYNPDIGQWEAILAGQRGFQGYVGAQGSTGSQGFTGAQGNVGPGDIINSGPDTITSFWSGTQVQYDALGTYNNNTLYFIRD